MKLIAMVTERGSVTRYLAKIGELTAVPERAPSPAQHSEKDVAYGTL